MPQVTSPSREAVLASAIAAFARKGYAGTSVQDILRATGLSKPTLYYHFGSKEGLFGAIIESAYNGAYDAMQPAYAAASSPAEVLAEMAEGLFAYASEHQHLMRLLFATAFAAPEEIPPRLLRVTRRRRIQQRVREIIADCQLAGTLTKDYTADELLQGFFGAVSHQIRTWLLRTEGTLNRKQARRTVSLFLKGASTRKRKS